jgi:hypothetical protein
MIKNKRLLYCDLRHLFFNRHRSISEKTYRTNFKIFSKNGILYELQETGQYSGYCIFLH